MQAEKKGPAAAQMARRDQEIFKGSLIGRVIARYLIDFIFCASLK
jgi:hypothetical protein